MKRFLFTLTLLLTVSLSTLAKDIHRLIVKSERMHCGHCSEKIVKHTKQVRGVKKVETNLESHEIIITYDADKVSEATLLSGLNDLGYSSVVVSNTRVEKPKPVDGVTGATR